MQAQCEATNPDPLIMGRVDDLVGEDQYTGKIQRWVNLGVGVYLGKLYTNLRGPKDPRANVVKGWGAVQPEQWEATMSGASARRGRGLVAIAAMASVLALLVL